MHAKKISYDLELWEQIAILICIFSLLPVIVSEFYFNWFTQRFPIIFSSLTGIISGIISAVSVLYFKRLYDQNKLLVEYSKIEGDYTRKDMGQDNTPLSNLGPMKDENIGLGIKLTYKGNGTNTFNVDVEYWRKHNSKVSAIIEFSQNDKMFATGRYLHVAGDFKGHFGTYTVYRFKEDDSSLLVLYHHLFPRLEENNPDKNKGWEIWTKI